MRLPFSAVLTAAASLMLIAAGTAPRDAAAAKRTLRSAPDWLPALAAAAPVDVSALLGTDGSDPHVAAALGRSVVVWTSETWNRELVLAEGADAAWEPPRGASLDQRLSPSGPWTGTAVDRHGRTHFVFAGSEDSGNYEIYYNSWHRGECSGVENVSRTDGGRDWGGSNYPGLSVAPDGCRYVVWYDDKYCPDRWNLFLRFKNEGAPDWGPEIVLDIAPNVYQPEIAVDPDGTAHMIFARRDHGSSIICYTSSVEPRNPGAWTGEAVLSDQTGVDFCDPSLAVGGGGEACVVWEQYDGAGTDIFIRRTWNMEWSGVVNVSQTPGESRFADVAVDPRSGTVCVAWLERRAGLWFVCARTWHPETGWSAARDLAETGLGDGVDYLKYARRPGPSVAFDEGGGLHLAYIGRTGRRAVLYKGVRIEAADPGLGDETGRRTLRPDRAPAERPARPISIRRRPPDGR